MKPSPQPPDDEGRNDDAATPTNAPRRSSTKSTQSSSQAHATTRQLPRRLSEIDASTTDDDVDSESEDSTSSAGGEAGDAHITARSGAARPGAEIPVRKTVSSAQPSLEDVAKMRDAVLQGQHRTRTSQINMPLAKGAKRPSPIREEEPSPRGTFQPGMEVTYEDAGVNSPPSITSTGSQRTIRGSVPPTPAGTAPLRTPSYPFPYVPGTPMNWQNLHQPFTALSPTVMNQARNRRAEEASMSDDNEGTSIHVTPAANSAFRPRQASVMMQAPEDPRFPAPNLYETVLQLNAEPGIEQWWMTVTNLMHDSFMAERATLVAPLDSTDVENVPWGQKATFNMHGREYDVPQQAGAEFPRQGSSESLQRPEVLVREPSTDVPADDLRPQKLHSERLRPRLESRHSYAGHGKEARDAPATLADPPRAAQRPSGPLRTATYAPGMGTGATSGRPPFLSRRSSIRGTQRPTTSEMEFSGTSSDAPHAEVFSKPVALDRDIHPLIEAHGINHVIRRGGIVTVTRDYASEASGSSRASDVPTGPASSSKKRPNDLASESDRDSRREYQEYEQIPHSPWSLSPAPSPAVQADEESNPFFAGTSESVEDAFDDPVVSPQDFAQYAASEAIGVDHASTVMHIPLIHPTLSHALPQLGKTPRAEDFLPTLRRSSTWEVERKAPIAILSILSSNVPYPPSLIHALQLLGPHLATSYWTALQFSAVQPQAVSIRHRRTASGNPVPAAPMTIEPASLEEIMRAQIEGPRGSMTDSITSPSDYSGRSRYSPGSLFGTPGWDAGTHWPASRSVVGTPAAQTPHEKLDSYFEAKKRTGPRSASNASSNAQSTPAKAAKTATGQDTKLGIVTGDEDAKAVRGQRPVSKAFSPTDSKDDRSPTQPRGRSPPPLSRSVSTQRPQLSRASQLEAQAKQHTLLHSYGADFQASFGMGGTDMTGEPNTPFGHARKRSYPEDMPPPSERLLRTIIDSVPVQIFTARPETGELTWVNSKFLIYRGQEPGQVRSNPWESIHPDDREEFANTWHRSLRTNQQLQQKVRLQRFDRHYRWFYVRAAPLKDRNQKIVHWIGTMMDFHEQHLAEQNSARQQETAASEAKYRAVANSSPQVVFAVNRVAGVTFCNSQWLHYSGQVEAQALGVGFMDYVHPDDITKCRLPIFDAGTSKAMNVPTSMPPEPRRTMSGSAESSSGSSETDQTITGSDFMSSPTVQMPQRKLSELASTGILKVSRDADGRPSYSTEVRLKSKEGVYRWHLVRVLLAAPVLQAGQEEETWYGTCTDINDHKTLERDLKETMDEKSRFLSNMSHEIRTPLNGITGMVNFLIDSSLSSEQMEHVNIIRTSTEGLRGLINDILDLSKAEAGMIQLNMDWLYVRSLIEEVNDLTSTMAIDKGLELNYIVESDVPPQIKGDRFRIRQILLNVSSNALKFTQQGEVFIRCCLQADVEGVLAQNEIFLRFEIVDTGRGFTDKEAESLFKRFSQIDSSSTRQHGGSGLGLVISRQLTQLHGGDMGAKGVPGKGATFTFFIKTSVPSVHDQPPPPTPGVGTIAVPPPDVATPSTAPVSRKQSLVTFAETQPKPSPRYGKDLVESPAPTVSPGSTSSGSVPSIHSASRSSIRSARSSASSYVPDPEPSAASMKLTLPPEHKLARTGTSDSISSASSASHDTLRPPGSPGPLLFSILVVASLKFTRQATVHHIDKTLPRNIPHQITARESLAECQEMLGGDEPVTFTHVVAVLQDVDEIAALMQQVFASQTSNTMLVLITDLAQRRKIMERAPEHDYDALVADRRLRCVYKPLKPSRLGLIFDPQKEREMSTDRNQDSAAQVATSQKAIFEETKRRLGDRGKRVLLVEDNRINTLVILKFFKKVSIELELAGDGVLCTEKVFAHPHGYYDMILCDLHMPNKDGYQTCRELRAWERGLGKGVEGRLPVIALSANVLGDVYQKCVEAGFHSYMTKPVDFGELSAVLVRHLDPGEGQGVVGLMRGKKGQHAGRE